MLQIYQKNAEVKLVEMLNLVAEPAEWQAVHFHLNHLLEQYQSEYQVKIAVNLIYDLLKEYDGGVFVFQDNSIMVVCQRLERTLAGKLVFQLRYLYMDDPLAYTDDGHENPEFCTLYNLGLDWQEFLQSATRRMAMSVRRPVAGKPLQTKPFEPPPLEAAKSAGHGMSPSRLAGIEDDLRHADLTRVIRRQPVCTMAPNVGMRRVFDELYIHIAHLRQMLKSDEDFLSNRWLFKYLTHILDERMIELIKLSPATYLESPISINLNVETLLSHWFTEFDAVIKPQNKVSIVIELPVLDLFADMSAFHYARQALQKLGYRVCLDGLSTESFINIEREKLGLDLVKVQWNADAASKINSAENQAVARAVQATGSNRIILCRCDNKQAVEYGQALGISLFQGRHVDALLNPQAQVQN